MNILYLYLLFYKKLLNIKTLFYICIKNFMKKQIDKIAEDNMLEELNSFMKRFNIDEIEFGKKHKLKRTKDKKAESVVKKNTK
jgi:hypothetical protein